MHQRVNSQGDYLWLFSFILERDPNMRFDATLWRLLSLGGKRVYYLEATQLDFDDFRARLASYGLLLPDAARIPALEAEAL